MLGSHQSLHRVGLTGIPLFAVARRSWVFRGVVRGFSEEARTRGFPSPSFGGYGFVAVIL